MRHTPLHIGHPHQHPIGVSLLHRPLPNHTHHRPLPKPAPRSTRFHGLFAKTRGVNR